MIDRRDVHEVRFEVRGEEPPHEWTLTVEGFCREKLDDRVIEIFHRHGGEMVPDIVAAIERVVMRRVRAQGTGKKPRQEWRDTEPRTPVGDAGDEYDIADIDL